MTYTQKEPRDYTWFVADKAGVIAVQKVTVTTTMQTAYDVLDAAGMVEERYLTLLAVAEREGDDPVKLARKLVQFRQIVTGATP